MLEPRSRKHKNQAYGFTLIELMVTMACISVMATYAVPVYIRYIEKARNVEAIENLASIATGAKAYYEAFGMMPSKNPSVPPDGTSSGHCHLVHMSINEVCKNHNGIYPKSEIDTVYNLPTHVCLQLAWKPEGNVRFYYYFTGLSRTSDHFVNAYVEAYRLENCSSTKLIRFYMIFYRDRDGNLRAAGPIVRRTF